MRKVEFSKFIMLFKNIYKLLKPISIYVFYELIPVHFVLSLLFPNKYSNPKPSTFLIWIIGIYTAIYSLTHQNYENQKNILENRITFALSMTSKEFKFPILSHLQKTEIPLKPRYFKIGSTIRSFSGKKDLYQRGITDIKLILLNLSDSLFNANLDSIDLRSIRVKDAKILNSTFIGSKLSGITIHCSLFENNQCLYSNIDNALFVYNSMRETRFLYSNLINVEFSNCDLKKTDFRGADLRGARFANCQMDSTNFAFADLRGINFTSSNFENAISFYKARMDDRLRNNLETKYPKKFKRESKDPKFGAKTYIYCK